MNKQELFDKLIVPYLSNIKQLICYYTKNTNDIEDNFQEVCISLFTSIDKIDPTNNLRSYIHVSVKHCCMKTSVKAFKTPKTTKLFDDIVEETSVEYDFFDFKQLLSEEQRNILSLRLKGLNLKETAEKLHISKSTILKRNKILKHEYKKYLNFEN